MSEMNCNTKKRTCIGCRAFFHSEIDVHCELGYSIHKNTVTKDGLDTGMFIPVPLEQCPKPKTNKDFIFARNHFIKSKIVK